MVSGAEAPPAPATAVGEFVRYALAIVGFVAIGFVTKVLLTWTTGPLYFVLVLEVLPRTWRRLRRASGRPAEASGS